MKKEMFFGLFFLIILSGFVSGHVSNGHHLAPGVDEDINLDCVDEFSLRPVPQEDKIDHDSSTGMYLTPTVFSPTTRDIHGCNVCNGAGKSVPAPPSYVSLTDFKSYNGYYPRVLGLTNPEDPNKAYCYYSTCPDRDNYWSSGANLFHSQVNSTLKKADLQSVSLTRSLYNENFKHRDDVKANESAGIYYSTLFPNGDAYTLLHDFEIELKFNVDQCSKYIPTIDAAIVIKFTESNGITKKNSISSRGYFY